MPYEVAAKLEVPEQIEMDDGRMVNGENSTVFLEGQSVTKKQLTDAGLDDDGIASFVERGALKEAS